MKRANGPDAGAVLVGCSERSSSTQPQTSAVAASTERPESLSLHFADPAIHPQRKFWRRYDPSSCHGHRKGLWSASAANPQKVRRNVAGLIALGSTTSIFLASPCLAAFSSSSAMSERAFATTG